jgi:ATP-binding cassette subfamily B protein
MNNNDIKEVIKSLRKYECVLQEGAKDCGVASLLTIIKYYNGSLPKEYLRNITNTTNDGVSALALIEAGRKLGFDTKGVEGDALELHNAFLPCIAHVILDKKYKHFVVVFEINRRKNYVIIGDPRSGIIKMSIDDFRKISTKTFLLFRLTKQLPTIKTNDSIKNSLYSILFNNKYDILLIILNSKLYTFLNIVVSFTFEFVIDKSLSQNSVDNLYILLSILFFLYMLKNVSYYYRNKLINFISHKFDYILINSSFSHILSLPYIYYKNRTTGEILTRVNDLAELRDLLSSILVTISGDLILAIFSLIILGSINLRLSIILVSIIIINTIISLIINEMMNNKLKEIKENSSKSNSYMIELIGAEETLKGQNIIDNVLSNFNIKYNKLLCSSYDYNNLSNNLILINNLSSSLITLLIMLIGSKMVLDGTFTLSKLITFNALSFYFIDPIKNVVNIKFNYKKMKIVKERINELLELKEENLYLDTNLVKEVKGDIEIRDLTYSYNKKDKILDNISLKIKEKEKVVIVSPSGYGKSTLSKIIARYIDIEKGHVYINNIDINDYNLWSIREDITYSSQNEFIFTDSIYNNLKIKNTCDEEIRNTCKMMLIDEIYQKRNCDINMLLEENGSNLSGGERQRVILGRTFLKKSNIYILDEAFSEIDKDRERIILNNIFKKYKDKTIIVISHKNDNIDIYDRVIDLSNLKYGY